MVTILIFLLVCLEPFTFIIVRIYICPFIIVCFSLFKFLCFLFTAFFWMTWLGFFEKLSAEELMLLNYSVGEDFWESLVSILKEISHEYSLEGLMLKLKLQYCGYLMRRTDSLEKTQGRRRRRWQRMRWLDSIIDWMDMSLSRLWELVMNRGDWHATVYGVTKSRTWLNNWTELNWTDSILLCFYVAIITLIT